MLNRLSAGFAVALLASVSAANAGTISCGSPTAVTVNSSPTASCYTTGNGNNVTGNNDPVNQAGYVTLDTTTTIGLLTLTFSLANSGQFSFTASALYTDYLLGIQTTEASPKPDYFVFSLPSGVTSGTYSINNTGTLATGAVLYGHLALAASPVPGPVVGAGLPGLVMALGGLVILSRRRRNQAAVA